MGRCLDRVILNKSKALISTELYVLNLAEDEEVFVECFLCNVKRQSSEPDLTH